MVQGSVKWEGGLRFLGESDGRQVSMDGDAQTACTPVELLLFSLAGCMASDIVHILGRMRADLRTVTARIEGARAETAPRRFTNVKLHFDIGGHGISATQVERALVLSKEKYCSVYHSLRTDINIVITHALI